MPTYQLSERRSHAIVSNLGLVHVDPEETRREVAAHPCYVSASVNEERIVKRATAAGIVGLLKNADEIEEYTIEVLDPQENPKQFKFWSKVERLGFFRVGSGEQYFKILICENERASREGHYLLVVIDDSSGVPLIQAREMAGDDLVWTFRPIKQDGKNAERLQLFEKILGDKKARIPIPTNQGQVEPFLEAVFKTISAREAAQSLSVDGHSEKITPTYLLTWVPKRFPWRKEKFADQIAALDRGEVVTDTWSTGSTKRIEPGQRVVLMRLGESPKGVFGTGRTTSSVREEPHWEADRAARGETRKTVSIVIDELINPWSQPVLEQERLKESFPEVHWAPQGSGMSLPDSIVGELEILWQRHLLENGIGPLRYVSKASQLRDSIQTFAQALEVGDPRTQFAVFHPEYFVFDEKSSAIAPAKWAAFRGMTPEVYAALQHIQRDKGQPRGFSGSRGSRHIARLLGTEYSADEELTALLRERFTQGFGEKALGNRNLVGISFVRVPASGEMALADKGGSPPVGYWKLAPEEQGKLWDLWREESIITIGWGELGDLSGASREDFERKVEDARTRHPSWTKQGLEQVWKFKSLREGDRIVANVGTTRVVGIGTVVGSYYYVDGVDHGHRMTVRWDDLQERRVDRGGWRRTLIKLKRTDFEKIVKAPPIEHIETTEDNREPTTDTDYEGILSLLEDQKLHFPEELVANFLLSLQAKRFVILTGISGTGKTRLALEIAKLFQLDGGEDVSAESLAGDGVDVAIRPYMLRHRRLVVPAELAMDFLAARDASDESRIYVELPNGERSTQAFYTKTGTRLLQVLFSGQVRDWFQNNLTENDTVRLERIEDSEHPAGVLRFSLPAPSSQRPQRSRSYEVVAVRPDWTDHRALLGFYNPLTQHYALTPFLSLLLRASENWEQTRSSSGVPRPFFVILDEMNLARVEHYFSDFLSAMESGEPLELHQDQRLEEGEAEDGVAIPRRLRVPPNLFFVGTVNVDETTYLFSPKVLDRAFTLELNKVDLESYCSPSNENRDVEDAPQTPISLTRFDGTLRTGRGPSPTDWENFCSLDNGRLRKTVLSANSVLETENRHFGYRVANEIARFVNLASSQSGGGVEALWAALDLALLQKVLPKLHGTQQELDEILIRLLAFAITTESHDLERAREITLGQAESQVEPARLPRTAAKIKRMIRRLQQQGFTSFIE